MSDSFDPQSEGAQPDVLTGVEAQIEKMQAELKALKEARLKVVYDELHHAWVEVRRIEGELARRTDRLQRRESGWERAHGFKQGAVP